MSPCFEAVDPKVSGPMRAHVFYGPIIASASAGPSCKRFDSRANAFTIVDGGAARQFGIYSGGNRAQGTRLVRNTFMSTFRSYRYRYDPHRV